MSMIVSLSISIIFGCTVVYLKDKVNEWLVNKKVK